MKKNTGRKYKRFKVKRGVFLKIRELLKLNCKIVDISRGGMGFVYNDIGDRPGEKIILEIFVKKNGFHIMDLPARIIWDYPVSNRFYFNLNKKRMCQTQFVGLLQGEADRLSNFINNYANGEV